MTPVFVNVFTEMAVLLLMAAVIGALGILAGPACTRYYCPAAVLSCVQALINGWISIESISFVMMRSCCS